MSNHPQQVHGVTTIDPVELWKRAILNLREARRKAPIMMDFEGYDGSARDAAAEAYVIAAEALVTDLGTLLELGLLEEVEEFMKLATDLHLPR